MFVIKRNDGAFVAKSGSSGSYTRDLANARKWQTLEGAQAELCPGNEHIVNLERELDRFRS